MHLDVVRCGCLTLVSGGETDTLVWEWDVPEGVPRRQIRVRRRRAWEARGGLNEPPGESASRR